MLIFAGCISGNIRNLTDAPAVATLFSSETRTQQNLKTTPTDIGSYNKLALALIRGWNSPSTTSDNISSRLLVQRHHNKSQNFNYIYQTNYKNNLHNDLFTTSQSNETSTKFPHGLQSAAQRRDPDDSEDSDLKKASQQWLKNSKTSQQHQEQRKHGTYQKGPRQEWAVGIGGSVRSFANTNDHVNE